MIKTSRSNHFSALKSKIEAAIQEGRLQGKASLVEKALQTDKQLSGTFLKVLKSAAGEVFPAAGPATPKKSAASAQAETPVRAKPATASAGTQTDDLVLAQEELDDEDTCAFPDHLSCHRAESPEAPEPDTARIRDLEAQLKVDRKEIRRLKRSLDNSKRKAENSKRKAEKASAADAKVRSLEAKLRDLGEELKETQEARDQAERAKEAAERRIEEQEYETNEAANNNRSALEAAPRGRLATNRRHQPQPTPEPLESPGPSRESTSEPMIEESSEPTPPPRPRKRRKGAVGPASRKKVVKRSPAKKPPAKPKRTESGGRTLGRKHIVGGKPKPKPKGRKRKRDEPMEYLSHEYMKAIVKCRIKVWWPLDARWYEGLCTSYRKNRADGKGMHVNYDDGEKEWLNLKEEDFEVVDPPENLPVNPNPSPRRKRRRTDTPPPDEQERRELGSEDTDSEMSDNVAEPSGKDRSRPRGPQSDPDPGDAYEEASRELAEQEASRGDVVSALLGQGGRPEPFEEQSEEPEEDGSNEPEPDEDPTTDNTNRRKGKKEGPMENEDMDLKRDTLKEDMHVEVLYDNTSYDGVILNQKLEEGESFYNIEIIALKPLGEDQCQVWLTAADITLHEPSEGSKGIQLNSQVQAADGSCWFDGICQEILQGVDGPVYKIMFPDYNSFEWLPEDRVRKRQDQNLGR